MTLGQRIREARRARDMSLQQLAQRVKKEDDRPVSGQYLHDVEKDRRAPSQRVFDQIARALGLDALELRALAGRSLPEVENYLRARPEDARGVAAFFERAARKSKIDWGGLL